MRCNFCVRLDDTRVHPHAIGAFVGRAPPSPVGVARCACLKSSALSLMLDIMRVII